MEPPATAIRRDTSDPGMTGRAAEMGFHEFGPDRPREQRDAVDEHSRDAGDLQFGSAFQRAVHFGQA